MRIPFSIVIPLCLLVTLGVWMIRAKKFGTIQEPSQEEIQQASTSITSDAGPIRKVQPKYEPQNNFPIEVADEPEPDAPSKPRLTINVETANIAPGLSEYAGESTKGAAHLLELGEVLTESNFGERALLAYERVLDSANATPIEQNQAVTQIKRLTKFLPPWAIDPSEATPLRINISVPNKYQTLAEEAAKSLTELFGNAASGLIEMQSTVSTYDPKGKPERLSVWFNTGTKEEERISQVFTTLTSDTFSIDSIYRSTYQMIRSHLSMTTDFKALPELSEEADAKLLLSHSITRLVWKEIPRTLKSNKEES